MILDKFITNLNDKSAHSRDFSHELALFLVVFINIIYYYIYIRHCPNTL